ncbi:MAG: MurR/RpiR family transcriptional regulator [Burkholderiaceae bacterium]
MTLVDRIRITLNNLAPAEARVGRLVVDDPSGFSRLPVAELAARARVSKPTVVRFCRSLGYQGLSDFKLKLAGDLAQGVPFVHQGVQASDDINAVVSKVLDNHVSTLIGFRNQVSSRQFGIAADALTSTISRSGRIEFYGAGNSGIVAQDGQHKLFRMGCNTIAYADGHMMVMAATLLTEKDSAIIISNSGRSRDLLDAAEIAMKRGATVIAITASGSPLASCCTVLLAADHTESYDTYSPMASRLLHLSIIDILSTLVAMSLGQSVQQLQLAIKENLVSRRYRAS